MISSAHRKSGKRPKPVFVFLAVTVLVIVLRSVGFFGEQVPIDGVLLVERSDVSQHQLPIEKTETPKVDQLLGATIASDVSSQIQKEDSTTDPRTSTILELSEETYNPQEQSCLDLTESTNAFIRAVHDDAEKVSLRTFTATGFNGQQWEFPAFDHSLLTRAFGGRITEFMGDSTSYYTLQNLYELTEILPLELVNSMKEKDLSPAFQGKLDYYPENNLKRKEVYFYRYERTWTSPGRDQQMALWTGFRGSNQHLNCQFETQVFPNILKMKPEILIANVGLHLLFRRFTAPCNVQQWLQYEQLLERTVEVAKEAQVKLLLFKTTNLICANIEFNKETRSVCEQKLQEWVKEGRNFTKADIGNYCENGLMEDKASVHLNQRVTAMVQEFQKRTDLNGMKIEVYNDHDMESCHYTGGGDGLHYHFLQVPRIRLLAHMINCLLPQESSTSAA